ncbi:YceI family protein [Flavobacterium sp.]|uniref:YceI family protein n=1 Tax=Flavobacterium sp. TaxID=239 RepID=UPI0028BD6C96|nr:YceI family protein [Flavobacterium sp.]
MKKIALSLVLVASLFVVSCKKDKPAEGSDTVTTQDAVITPGDIKLAVNTSESVVNWIGSKPAGKHTGTISIKEGDVTVKDGEVQNGTFILDMNSIAVTDLKAGDGKEDLEAHLKGTKDKEAEDHFFNVKKYPTGKFIIAKVAHENGKTIVYGNLTLKNITKAVNFPATVVANDSLVSIESEPLMINRTFWNINYGSKSVFDDLKDKFINDEVEIKVNVKASKI